jgi:hypothetical protein
VTEIYRRGTLVVWFYESGDGMSTGPREKATFSGQDLGGYPGADEYEYFFSVDPDELRAALGAASEADLTQAVLTHADEIVTTGERSWLDAHSVSYDFHSHM